MSNLITISGVRGFINENGVAQLNLEDVSRGLGFTQTAASGNEVIRWERVRGYLADLKVIPTSGDAVPEFIPENIFYRLAMKAKNETAEKFQALVADEILPTIRKTGTYSIPKPLRAKQSIPRVKPAVKDALDTAKLLESIGVKPGIAQAACLRAVEKNWNLDLQEIAKCLPFAQHDIGRLNATQVGKRLGLSAVKTNLLLVDRGLQVKENDEWRLTEGGKEYAEEMPYVRNGHSGYQIQWSEAVIDILEGQQAAK